MAKCNQLRPLLFKGLMHVRGLPLIFTLCLKKLCKFVLVRTSSNFHQFW